MNRKIECFRKWRLTVVAFAVASIPTWLWLFIYFTVKPQSFWEKFAVLGVGVVVLGGLQFALALMFVGFMFTVWSEIP
ncbi:MAG TPA: hypothetical protein PLZ95_07720 [Bryobacteraceae bacterium]|nr:hypothetical protein [Bryobacteraceae bacterium]